jgi:hypothetical protein
MKIVDIKLPPIQTKVMHNIIAKYITNEDKVDHIAIKHSLDQLRQYDPVLYQIFRSGAMQATLGQKNIAEENFFNLIMTIQLFVYDCLNLAYTQHINENN